MDEWVEQQVDVFFSLSPSFLSLFQINLKKKRKKKSKDLQPILLYLARLSFRIKGQKKSFPDKKKLKKFITKPWLCEMLKGFI